jgi:hypothetical protein
VLRAEAGDAIVLGGAAPLADREIHAAAAVAQRVDCRHARRYHAILFCVNLRETGNICMHGRDMVRWQELREDLVRAAGRRAYIYVYIYIYIYTC